MWQYLIQVKVSFSGKGQKWVNMANVPISYPLKTENLRGFKMEALAINGLNAFFQDSISNPIISNTRKMLKHMLKILLQML